MGENNILSEEYCPFREKYTALEKKFLPQKIMIVI